MKNSPHGILLVDKAEGESSFDVVRKVRSLLGGGRRLRVGHAGTLDPFATGLLVVMIGKGTKLSPFLMAGRKRYRAVLVLGEETDTLDPTGRVTRTAPVPPMDGKRLREVAGRFVGEIEQVPPAYSAVKSAGKRAYALARKGLAVRLRPRKVWIYSLEVLDVDQPQVAIEVECSSGTYVRSLAADMAHELGTCGHLGALRRLSSGSFRIEEALPSRGIGKDIRSKELAERVIPLRDALPEMEEIRVSPSMAESIGCGRSPYLSELPGGPPPPGRQGRHVKLVRGDRLIAIGLVETGPGRGRGRVKLVRVLGNEN